MNLQEFFTGLKSSGWFYFIIIGFFALLIYFISRNRKINNLRQRINLGQIKVNDMKSHPFAVDIAKTDAIARVNNDIKSTSLQCKKDFDQIQNNLKTIVNNLQDANEFLIASKFNDCALTLDDNDQLIEETEQLTKKLDDVLKSILNQSTLQRKRINELKGEFHDIKSLINENPNNYTFCWEALDKITNEISHKFSDFEAIMEASRYEDATIVASAISSSIERLNILIQKLPELIKLSRETLPARVNEIITNYQVLTSEGAYLDHLNVAGTVDNINGNLMDCLKKIKECAIDDVDSQLFDCDAKINQLNNRIEEERNAFKDLNKMQKACKDSLDDACELFDSIAHNDSLDFDRYELKQLQSDYLSAEKDIQNNKAAFDSLAETIRSQSIPATTLIITFKEIYDSSVACQNKLKEIAGKLTNTKTNELRVKELIAKYVVVLNESKATIRISRLPNISEKYQQDIASAENYLKQLEEKLSKQTIDIDDVNQIAKETDDVIIKLYKNVELLVDTAKEIEDFIVACNKYRPYYPDLDSGLYSAELAYRNGEYTKACRIASNALETINPELSKKLSENINKKLALQKEAA